MADNKVVVISIDSLFSSDLKVFALEKNIGSLLKGSAIVENIECVYPTYTYPCHASIMTGCFPNKHGIVNSGPFEINQIGQKWYWYKKDIRVPTLIEFARKHNLSSATICWPVMGGANSSDYNIAEIWPQSETDDPTPVFDKANSPSVKHIFEKNKHILNYNRTPEFDFFATACACDIIKEFKPDLTFIHLSFLDHQRHKYGCSIERVMTAVHFIDSMVGDIIKTVKEEGDYERTSFILLGDHGHKPVNKIFAINRVFAEKGWISHVNGNIDSWKMMAHSTSFSSQIYTNGIALDDAGRILRDMQKEYPLIIERVMTADEANRKYNLRGDFDFVIEAMPGVVFSQSLTDPIYSAPIPDSMKAPVSNHGFAPEKGPNPPFIVCGNQANAGARVKFARLVDEAPTILSLFGITMTDIDGKTIEQLFTR